TGGSTPYSYQWYTGNSGNTSNQISGATSSSYNAAPASTTSYWVLVTDSANGSAGPATFDSSTATITVNSPVSLTTIAEDTKAPRSEERRLGKEAAAATTR